MKSLVLTEYWKVVDSQSGRQSHWVADTFLIALKNLGVSSRLGGNNNLYRVKMTKYHKAYLGLIFGRLTPNVTLLGEKITF